MTAGTRIDDCLSTRDGHLFVESCDTVDLVREFGSPLFVLSEDQIRRNVRRFQQAFQDGWPDGPVKALPAAGNRRGRVPARCHARALAASLRSLPKLVRRLPNRKERQARVPRARIRPWIGAMGVKSLGPLFDILVLKDPSEL